MADNNPFLFVHLPLNEIRHGEVLDVSPNRRHGLSHNAKIVADETFGACLEFGPASYVKFPAWKLTPAVFLPRGANNPPPGALLNLTFTLWLAPPPSATLGQRTLIDAGLGKGLPRFTVQYIRQVDSRLLFTVQTPVEVETERPRGFLWTSEPIAADEQWVHFAVVWDPKNPRGIGMFVNGAPVIVQMPYTPTEPVSGLPVADTFLGSPTFSGKLAHFRIYTRELAQQEIAQEIDRDRAHQRKVPLIECSLLDPLENPLMFLYPSNAPRAEKMTLAVKPMRRGMKLAKLPADPPAPDKCHFELRFRRGVLDPSRTVESVSVTGASGAWAAKTYSQTGGVSVCIRCNSERDLAENVPLKMELNSLMADEGSGSRWTRIDLRYHLTDDQEKPLSGHIPQWLQLERRQPSLPPVLGLTSGWSEDLGTALRVSSENTFLQGRLVCADAQRMMKSNRFGPEFGTPFPNSPYLIAAYLPQGYGPWPKRDLRFAGHAQWLSAHSPEPLWQSDLCVLSLPAGAVGIGTENLPVDVYHAVRRIEVNLDGASYASEESLMRAGET